MQQTSGVTTNKREGQIHLQGQEES